MKESTKKKLSAALKGRKRSPQARKKQGATNTGNGNPHWKGGTHITTQGYVKIRIGPYQYEAEHRIVMSNVVGRKLTPKDIVHHINGDIKDNRPENLELTTRSKHAAHHGKLKNNLKRNNAIIS